MSTVDEIETAALAVARQTVDNFRELNDYGRAIGTAWGREHLAEICEAQARVQDRGLDGTGAMAWWVLYVATIEAADRYGVPETN